MQLPVHPHLMVLRTLITLELSLLIGQAGWASAGLGRDPGWFRLHAGFALPTLLGAWLCLIAYLLLRRTAGPVCVGLAGLLAAMAAAQFALGELAVPDVHIFLGVLTLMVATALTSWTYRLPGPVARRLPDRA